MRLVRFVSFLLIALCLVSCTTDPKKKRQKYLESGNRYFDHGNYKAARIMYINSYRTDPKFGEAYYRLALTETKLQHVANAVAPLRRAMELLPPKTPEYVDANVKFAEIMLLAAPAPDAGDRNAKVLDEVRQIRDMLLQDDPNSFEGTKLSGELALNDALISAHQGKQQEYKEQMEKAVALYRKTLSLKPGDTVAMMALAKTLGVYGELDQSEQLYRQVLDRDKTQLTPYTELYRLYVAKHQMPEGEAVLKRAIATHPNDYNLQILLAAHYFTVNNRPEMTKILNGIKSHFKEYPEAFMKTGDFYFRIGDADQAVRQYQEGMSADGRHRIDYQKHIVEVLVRQGKTAQAYEKDLEILKENPKDPEARGLKASFLLDKGDVDAAVTELQSVVTAKPDNFVARFNLGRAYYAKGDLEQARQQFESALKQRPDYMPARLALSQLALRRGDPDTALKLAQETLKMNPNSGISTLFEAAALVRKGQYDEGRGLLQKILKANPNQADTLLELAVLDLVQKHYKDSAESFRKAYAADPSNLNGLKGLSEILFAQNEPAKAVQVIADEVQKQPQRADLKKELAYAEYRAKQFDKAIADYQSVLDRFKDAPMEQADVYNRIGNIYFTKGDTQGAFDNMNKARQLVPNNVLYVSQCAQYLDVLGKRAQALTTYRDAMKIDPNNPVVLNNLAYLLTSTGGNLDEALTLAQRAKQQLPNLYEVSDTIGWIYIKKKLSDSAIEIFKDLNTRVTDNSTFHYHYGLALAEKGDKANALRELNKAIQFKPKKDEEDQIKELIQKLS